MVNFWKLLIELGPVLFDLAMTIGTQIVKTIKEGKLTNEEVMERLAPFLDVAHAAQVDAILNSAAIAEAKAAAHEALK